MERAFLVFKDARFERLAGISVSHLYNLRGGTQYQRTRRHWTETRGPRAFPSASAAPPGPNGRPGYIRIDSVHQGDQDGVKGVYHINAVDSVTQFQLVPSLREDQRGLFAAGHPAAVGGISVCDPGSSSGQRLRVHQLHRWPCCWRRCASSSPNLVHGTPTTTRWPNPRMARWCGNIWVMRTSRNRSPHRSTHSVRIASTRTSTSTVPASSQETITDAKGKERKRYHYRDMKTPYEKLKSIPDVRQYLEPGITVGQLDAQAAQDERH